MTKTELSTFRNILVNRHAELGNGIRNRETLSVETSPDELDRIQHGSERDYEMNNFELNSDALAGGARRPAAHECGNIWNLHRLRRGNPSQAPGRNAMGVLLHCLPGGRRPRAENAWGRVRIRAGPGSLTVY